MTEAMLAHMANQPYPANTDDDGMVGEREDDDSPRPGEES